MGEVTALDSKAEGGAYKTRSSRGDCGVGRGDCGAVGLAVGTEG